MKNLSSIAVPDPLNKVPLATLAFWVIKIMSTTVGETGADYLAVNAGFGKGATSAAMAALLGSRSRRSCGRRPAHPGSSG